MARGVLGMAPGLASKITKENGGADDAANKQQTNNVALAELISFISSVC
jgi:hypothetical protein